MAVPSLVPGTPLTGPLGPPPLAGPPLGPGGPALYDRAPAAVLFAAIVVLAVLAGGIAYLVLSKDDRYPDEWDERVTALATWTARERGLEFEHPVEVNFLSESEYTAATTSEPTTEEDDEEIEAVVAEMRALGLVSGDLDLVDSLNTLSDSGTLAFYSPETKEVYVRGETLTPALRVTLVHELVHVLQDQHFDLSRMSDLPSTRAAVMRAVAEGDAGRIEDIYVDEALTDAERQEYENDSGDQGDEAFDTIRDEVPDALTALFSAPYIFGEPLVTYLDDTGGTDSIDEALRNPPSEEVLFNPHLWNSPEAEEIEVEVDMPSGATELQRDVFGPIAWYLVLSSRVDPSTALAAVDGLGGDSFVSYRDGQKVCVRMTVTGDDEAATATIEQALTQWVAAGPPDTSSVVRDDDSNLQFQACDPGTGDAAADDFALEVLALPATRTAVYLEVRNSGAPEDRAWCVADGLVRQFTLEDLVNPDLAQEQDLVAMMNAAMAGCSAGD